MKRLLAIVAALSASLCAQPVAVRQSEGQIRGFLILRNVDRTTVASGDSMQTVHNGKVVTHIIYRFKDGSVQDETTVFSQNGHFRVLSDHLIQKGPTFKHPIDMTVNATTGQVTVVHTDDKGERKTDNDHLDLQPDLANGIVPILLKNLAPDTQSITESMVVATPKPMLIKLQIHPEGEEAFAAGAIGRKATRYNVHVDIGGIKGAVADLIGKEPPDTLVWILPGDCPTFVRAQGPGFQGGPIWFTELVSPVFPNSQGIASRMKR